jgi:hypothetical protein
MKFSFIILSFGIFCQLAAAEYIVHAIVDIYGCWKVNVSMSPLNQTLQMDVKIHNQERIPFISGCFGPNTTELSMSLLGGEQDNTNSVYTYASQPWWTNEGGSPRANIGVSWGSALLRAAGSVAIIQSSGESFARKGYLVIESNLSSFNSTCFPGSFSRFNLTAAESHLENATVRAGGVSSPVDGFLLYTSLNAFNIAAVPIVIWAHVIDLLESNGAHLFREVTRITLSNCTRDFHLENLPLLEITTPDFGTLVIYPDEYIEFLPDNQCVVLLTPSLGTNRIELNPLVLSNLNLRISSNGIVEFCDAAETY